MTASASTTLSSSSSSIASTDVMTKKIKYSGYRVAVICMAYSILMTASYNIMNLPINRIFEISICRTYYQTHGPEHITGDGYVDEYRCKIQPVQSKLVSLVGWDNFLFEIPCKQLLSRPSSSSRSNITVLYESYILLISIRLWKI